MTIAPTTASAPTITAERGLPHGNRLDLPVEGGSLAVEQCGSGPALILLHGFTLDRRAWAPQAPLARRLTLIVFDRRGNGQSTAPPDMAREPDDILALADALGIDRFALLGHSQGARVAVHLALRAPDRISHLLLLGPPHDGVAERLPRAAMRTLARAGQLEPMRALWLAEPVMATRNDNARRLRDRIVADYTGRDLLEPKGTLPLADAQVGRLAVPLTVLVGSADTPARVAAARRIVGAAEGARLLLLEKAGHLASMEAPDAFNAALVDALGACPTA